MACDEALSGTVSATPDGGLSDDVEEDDSVLQEVEEDRKADMASDHSSRSSLSSNEESQLEEKADFPVSVGLKWRIHKLTFFYFFIKYCIVACQIYNQLYETKPEGVKIFFKWTFKVNEVRDTWICGIKGIMTTLLTSRLINILRITVKSRSQPGKLR